MSLKALEQPRPSMIHAKGWTRVSIVMLAMSVHASIGMHQRPSRIPQAAKATNAPSPATNPSNPPNSDMDSTAL